MNPPSNLVTLAQLIRDTFRQANASGICWMMLTVTAICVVLCLSVDVSGDVSLYGKDEPVLFLPPPSASTALSTMAAIQKAGGYVETGPETGLDATESTRSAAG